MRELEVSAKVIEQFCKVNNRVGLKAYCRKTYHFKIDNDRYYGEAKKGK